MVIDHPPAGPYLNVSNNVWKLTVASILEECGVDLHPQVLFDRIPSSTYLLGIPAPDLILADEGLNLPAITRILRFTLAWLQRRPREQWVIITLPGLSMRTRAILGVFHYRNLQIKSSDPMINSWSEWGLRNPELHWTSTLCPACGIDRGFVYNSKFYDARSATDSVNLSLPSECWKGLHNVAYECRELDRIR
jgi:hypothetical protein